MSVTEFQRHRLFQWLEEAMGPERAAIMMDLLPPVGWGDIATRDDLAMVRVEMAATRVELHGEIARLEGKMEHGFARLEHRMYLTTVAGNATLVGLVMAVLQLT